MKKLGLIALLVLFSTLVSAQAVFQYYGPANGIQYNNGNTFSNTAATASQIGTVLYPETSGEISCSATIVNANYAAGNILRYGTNTTPGTTDMTLALQTALNCNTTVYVPAGRYLIGTITMPQTFGQVLYGDGDTSTLVQKTSGQMLTWSVSGCCFNEQGTIRNLAFVGSSGTADTIHMVGVSGETLESLYFTDVPSGHDAVFVNGQSATYNHDVRLQNILIYYGSGTSSNAGIEFGNLSSDSSVSNFVMNGGFVVAYNLELDSGAQTLRVDDSHPYNATTHIVYGAGSNNNLIFTHDTFDNASTGDLILLTGGQDVLFADNFFEGVHATFNGVTLTNENAVSFLNDMWSGASGSGYTVNETGTSNFNYINGGNVGTNTNWTSGIHNFVGAGSYSCFVSGDTNSTGCSTVVSAANPTVSVGLSAVNGSATTYMRSDAAPPLSQSISPTMTGSWLFNGITTGAFASGTQYKPTVPSTATSRADIVQSVPSTAASAGTLPAIDAFMAQWGTLGSGTTLTSLIGYRADTSLGGVATNTYGFRSDLNSAANTWAFYGNGTAASYFGGTVALATSTAHGVLVGEAGSAVNSVAAMAADTLLQGQGTSADPVAVSVNNCGSSTQALSYSTSTHTFGCQTISSTGQTSGTFTSTISNGTNSASCSMKYYLNGSVVTLFNNSSSCTYTSTTTNIVTLNNLPSAIQPTRSTTAFTVGNVNSGAAVAGCGDIAASGSTISLSIASAPSSSVGISCGSIGFANSGTQGINGAWNMTYNLGN